VPGKILNQLAETGLQLAIDDFGTGFSSLNYLKNLPVDTLKIDKSFILDMHNSSNDHAIVKTIIELGHNLNCQVVAEGVEDQQTIDSLKQLNVDIMQGFFYSKPLKPQDFQDWLAQRFTPPPTLTSVSKNIQPDLFSDDITLIIKGLFISD